VFEDALEDRLPAAERAIPDFNNDICWINDLWQRTVFESDVQLSVEDHGFHCTFRHFDLRLQRKD
jgi:hypothetical protein